MTKSIVFQKNLQQSFHDDSGKAYDVKEVIAELVDNGDFFEVQEGFAKNIVIGFARMNGQVIGYRCKSA